MNKNEKILLIEVLLKDIRGNWGWENNKRDALAMELATELKNEVEGMEELANVISKYDGEDGRYFRESYPRGYECMTNLHGLSYTLEGKSKEFKKVALEYLTYPEFAFDDYNTHF